MAASVSYRINGTYDGKAVSQAKKGMDSLSSAAKTLKGALVAVGAVAGVKALVNQFKDASKTFKENNKVQTQMFQALSSNAKTAKGNIKELVKEFDSMSGIFSGSDIVKGGTLLARMGLDEDQMRKTTKAAKDLAASGIMTLDQAFDALGKSYSGNATSLKKLFPELQNLTKEELQAGKAVEILGKKFKGMENALGDTFEGQITILKDKIDSIKDTIGTMGGFLMQNGFEDMKILLDKVSDVANKFMPSIAAWTSTIIHAFANFDLEKLFDPKTVFEMWKNMFMSLAKSFEAVFNYLKSKVKDVWSANKLKGNQDMLADMQRAYNELARKNNRGGYEEERFQMLGEEIKEMEAAIEEQKELMKVKGMSLADLMSSVAYNTGKGLKDNLSLLTGEDMNAYYETMRDKYGEYRDSNHAIGGTGGNGAGGVTSSSGGSVYGFSLEDQAQALKDAIYSSIGDFATIIQSAIDGSSLGVIISMIGSAIKVISEKTTVLTEIFSVFDRFFRAIFNEEFINMLNSFFGPILSAVDALGAGLGYTLKILSSVFTPILQAIGKAIEIVAKVIQTVRAVIYNIYVAVWNAFHSKKNDKEYVSIADIWSNAGQTDYSNYSAGMYSPSSGGSYSGGGSASYNAARDVIVNINFNNSYVNGDARQIAVSLYNEFKSAERMGYIS